MKTKKLMIGTGLALGLMIFPAGADRDAARADEPTQRVELKYEAGRRITRLMTPRRILSGGTAFSVRGEKGFITVAGTPVAVSA